MSVNDIGTYNITVKGEQKYGVHGNTSFLLVLKKPMNNAPYFLNPLLDVTTQVRTPLTHIIPAPLDIEDDNPITYKWQLGKA